MPILSNLDTLEQVKVGTFDEDPAIQPHYRKIPDADIIIGSAAGSLVAEVLGISLNQSRRPSSSGSQQVQVYLKALSSYSGISITDLYERLDLQSVVLPAISLETKARNQVNKIFSFAEEYLQNEGISDILYDRVKRFLFKYDQGALKIIKELFDEGSINPEVINDTLSIIGDIEHPETSSSRLNLLEHFLYSPSHYVRDGAILGLANLNDSSAIKSLKEAAKAEKLSEIGKEIQNVISLLELYGTSSND